MKKSSAISIGIGVLILAAFTILLATRNNSQINSGGSSQSSSAIDSNDTKRVSSIEGGGTYVDYDKQKFSQTSGDKYLFFHAPWCPQCRSIEQGILAGPIPNNVNLFKVDYDSSQDLKQKYGVTLQTTFVKVSENSELIDKYVAYDEPTFESVITNFINK